MPRQRQGQLLRGLEILAWTDLYRHLLVAPPMETRRPTHRSKALLEDFANVRFGSKAETRAVEFQNTLDFPAPTAFGGVKP